MFYYCKVLKNSTSKYHKQHKFNRIIKNRYISMRNAYWIQNECIWNEEYRTDPVWCGKKGWTRKCFDCQIMTASHYWRLWILIEFPYFSKIYLDKKYEKGTNTFEKCMIKWTKLIRRKIVFNPLELHIYYLTVMFVIQE